MSQRTLTLAMSRLTIAHIGAWLLENPRYGTSQQSLVKVITLYKPQARGRSEDILTSLKS